MADVKVTDFSVLQNIPDETVFYAVHNGTDYQVKKSDLLKDFKLPRIYISTAVYNMLPVLTAQKILDTSVSADGYIPVLANKHYEFKLRCHITELSLSNNYLTFQIANSGVIATDFRYTSHSSKNSNAVTPTPEMRLIHNGGTGYTVMNALSVNSNSRPDMFIDIEGHFRTVTDGNIAPMLQININAAAAKIQPGLYFSIKEITLNN
jgi:hypothetical protein